MSIVIGTAGHIDHGKTSLVKALTGVDCDRLEEEKKRGITIELGFAALKLDNVLIGIVDVPGHEKFVKNMVAGASGIDAVMLVIAADEGVMPQTREHLEICTLLGIKHGLVALTKIDSVDEEMLELAKEDVLDFLKGSSLENAPIFPVSAIEAKGLEELKSYILKLNKELTRENKSDLFRLPVDRVFTMKGHGTVVTGTSIAGKALLNDELTIYPKDEIVTRIRAIQSHNEAKEEIEAGKRISINLANCSLEDIERGDVLAKPNSLFACEKWLVKLHCLKSAPKPILHRKEVHFHHGSKEMLAKVYLLDRQILEQGETCLAEVHYVLPSSTANTSKKQLVGVFNDHCVLRSSSPLCTVAGAKVLLPLEYKLAKKDFTKDLQEKLLNLEEYFYNEPQKLLLTQIEIAGRFGRNFNELLVLTALHSKQLEKYLNALLSKGDILCYNKELRSYINKQSYNELEEKFLKLLENFHKKEPLKQGMLRNMLISSKEIQLAAKVEEQKLALYVLDRLQKSQKVAFTNEVYHLPSFKVNLAKDEAKLEEDILTILRKSELTPPNMKDILEQLKISAKEAQAILKILLEKKSIIKLNENIYYDARIIEELEAKTRTYFESNEDLDPAAFKILTNGLSRKYSIAILEYFDRQKLTMRVGEVRKLRKQIL